MAKVVVANRLVVDGKTYKGGDVLDVSPGEARVLLGLGKVREFEEPAKQEVKGAKNG